MAGIGLTASLCLDGSAGITNGLSITSASGGIPEFADSTSYGLIEASVTPAGDGQTATASVDLAAIVGDIGSSLNIITDLPATTDLAWGLVDSGGEVAMTTYGASLDLENELLSGTVSVFVNRYSVSWCSAWWGSYPCGSGWSTIVSQPLVSYSGFNYNYNLMSLSGNIILEP